ncbi:MULTISPECIES: rSAM-modified peptide [Flavobacterium]|uniref:RSAM-modified peptide n=2 Tax=Flavobacterium TaxID=237 RepID=A0A940XFF3_9FLAO|nr:MULTISPECIES: rSAM-modified peptide [Flavobacterium]MBP4138719.1 rSAM-modified peptide [Flavobacterium geliluteum]MDX6181198.1 rSAM-modified peptide [Flavobacterium sp. Fl-33]MDX6184799.1 rSAM-modified peptide [Flavobacterium sp. Fl-77]UFH39896.1 rSAM-modified peptide [Flavobacterium sp. F-70]
MSISTFKLEDFKSEKLSKNQQKTVRGGDGANPNSGSDPGKTGGNGNN